MSDKNSTALKGCLVGASVGASVVFGCVLLACALVLSQMGSCASEMGSELVERDTGSGSGTIVGWAMEGAGLAGSALAGFISVVVVGLLALVVVVLVVIGLLRGRSARMAKI